MSVNCCSQTQEPDFWLTQMPHTLRLWNLVTTLLLPLLSSCLPTCSMGTGLWGFKQ